VAANDVFLGVSVQADSQNFLTLLRQKLSANEAATIAGDYAEAAVLVAVVQGAHESEIILTQRAGHLQLHPGESAFPGGKKECQDASLWQTALRESQEEIALPPHSVEYLGVLDQQLTRTNFQVSAFVGLLSGSIELKPDPNEIADIFTVPLRFFLNPINLQMTEGLYQNTLKQVPGFHYGQYQIWGVTALIIIDLINTVFDADIEIEH
jgi:8-oxo-dGTP pyrophosphatase MutT (NUDIX family)